jgi:hypothetical protein
MLLKEINYLGTQPLQRGVARLADVLGTGPAIVERGVLR